MVVEMGILLEKGWIRIWRAIFWNIRPVNIYGNASIFISAASYWHTDFFIGISK